MAAASRSRNRRWLTPGCIIVGLALLAAALILLCADQLLHVSRRKSIDSARWAVQLPPDGYALQPDGNGVFQHLTYIGAENIDQALQCPTSSHACFYAFVHTTGTEIGDDDRVKASVNGCTFVVRNCNRHGECIARRDWCIIRREAPAWLLERYPGRWLHEARPTYLFSRVDLLNPTHLASLHYLPLLRWMQGANVPVGEVLMLWDDFERNGPGEYGLGLAAPLGETSWLTELRGPIVFRAIRLGEFGDLRFPYHLKRHDLFLAEDATFSHLALLVKRHYGVAERHAVRPKVVIAKRQHTRILKQAEQLSAALQQAGIQAVVVDFAAMSFKEQVQTMADAAVLVSVHGADCMNLMFLPPAGAIVEIAPTHYGYGYRKILRKGDYFNLARLLGKHHLDFISTTNSTILREPGGHLVDWNHVNFVGEVPVDVRALLPVVQAAVMMACGSCYQSCGPTNSAGETACLPPEPTSNRKW